MGLYIAARHNNMSKEEAHRFTQKGFDTLSPGIRAKLTAEATSEVKENGYDLTSNKLTLSNFQSEAHEVLTHYYTNLFKDGNEDMGLQPGIVQTDEQGAHVAAFFGWLSWAAGTNRPGEDYTYTSNWPFDPLVGNRPLPGTLLWSIISVVILVLAIAVMIFVYCAMSTNQIIQPARSHPFQSQNLHRVRMRHLPFLSRLQRYCVFKS